MFAVYQFMLADVYVTFISDICSGRNALMRVACDIVARLCHSGFEVNSIVAFRLLFCVQRLSSFYMIKDLSNDKRSALRSFPVSCVEVVI